MAATGTPAFAALGLLAALTLVGCTAGTGDPGEPGGGEPSGAAEPGTGLTTESGGDCLVGDWMIAQDQLQAFYAQVGAESGLGLTVNGETALDFTATGYTYTPDFTMDMDISGAEASAEVTGTVAGDYTATDGVITTVNDVSSLDLQIVANGVPIDGSSLGNEIVSGHPINSAAYRCEAGAPVIEFATADSTVPITLTAR